MTDELVDILSESIDKSLVTDLVKSYTNVKSEFSKGDSEGCLSKSGKFSENVFRVLKFLKDGTIATEIRQGDFNTVRESLENTQADKLPESIRILMPRIATSMIYDTRSKLGAVHQKPIEPDFIDAKLTIVACDWIMAELLRLYHTRDTEKVVQIMKTLTKEYVPHVERKRGDIFVTLKGDCKDQILAALLHAGEEGLKRTQIGKIIKVYTPARITQSLTELEGKQMIG